MEAMIITIGDELLMGQVLNTNAQYIARKLTTLGVEVHREVTIHDDRDDIWAAVDEALNNVDLVIVSGGLGPTNDDITKSVLAKYFNTKLELNEQALEWVTELIRARGREINELIRSQATLPEKCQLLRNYRGTAPGMWFRRGWKSLIALPGVPFELEALLEEQVIPQLKKEYPTLQLAYRMVKVYGVTESLLAITLKAFEAALPEGIKLAYLPSAGYVRLRLTAKGKQIEFLDEKYAQMCEIISEFRFVEGEDVGLEHELKKSIGNSTIATAESCTGGAIAQIITSVPGSSEYFKGGIVAYSNDIKERMLGVDHESLLAHGAVSEEVVKQMAQGAREQLGAEYGVATSGIAGPGGGTQEKPVGTIWIAVATPRHVRAELFNFSYTRERNVAKAVTAALEMLLEEITNSSK